MDFENTFEIVTEIFGKRVRRPTDMVDDVEFEMYALESVERRVNDFIAQREIAREDIVTYKVKMKKKEEMATRNVKGGQQIREKAQFMTVRIYLSYVCHNSSIQY